MRCSVCPTSEQTTNKWVICKVNALDDTYAGFKVSCTDFDGHMASTIALRRMAVVRPRTPE